MIDNLFNLSESELDKPIYRIFSWNRLEEIFMEKKLTFVKPKLWDDPFENFILNSTGILPDGLEVEMSQREHYFGQCWSLNKESDAMWRIYSQDKDGVKVKTTIRKLFNILFKIGGEHQKLNGNIYNISSFVGKVKYESTKKLIDMLNDDNRMTNKLLDQSGWGQASTFFFKRIAFRHEHEIRFIYCNENNKHNEIYKFDMIL